MYDPVTARFLQEDTYTGRAEDPLSLNLYTYCHNEPIMYWDYSGHAEGDWWDVWSNTKLFFETVTDPKKREEAVKLMREHADSGPVKNMAINSAEIAGDVNDTVKAGLKNAKTNGSNWAQGIKDTPKNPKDAALGAVKSVSNGGLEAARLLLTGMSSDKNGTYSQLGEPIDNFNATVEKNVENENVYLTYVTITDAIQMASAGKALVSSKPTLNITKTTEPALATAGRTTNYITKEEKAVSNISKSTSKNPSSGVGGDKKAGFGERINTPSYKKVEIDMEEVITGHTTNGSRAKQSQIKDLFADDMSEAAIEKEVRLAYKNGQQVGSPQFDGQTTRIKLQGNGQRGVVEMWYNVDTKVIETAYPISGKKVKISQ